MWFEFEFLLPSLESKREKKQVLFFFNLVEKKKQSKQFPEINWMKSEKIMAKPKYIHQSKQILEVSQYNPVWSVYVAL